MPQALDGPLAMRMICSALSMSATPWVIAPSGRSSGLEKSFLLASFVSSSSVTL